MLQPLSKSIFAGAILLLLLRGSYAVGQLKKCEYFDCKTVNAYWGNTVCFVYTTTAKGDIFTGNALPQSIYARTGNEIFPRVKVGECHWWTWPNAGCSLNCLTTQTPQEAFASVDFMGTYGGKEDQYTCTKPKSGE